MEDRVVAVLVLSQMTMKMAINHVTAVIKFRYLTFIKFKMLSVQWIES